MPRRTTWSVPAGLLLAALLAPAAAAGDAPPAEGVTDAVIVARPGGDEVLDLADCLARALQGNDALLAERQRRRELDGQMNQALATGLPTLDAVGTWARNRDPSFALDSTFGGGDGEIGTSPLDSLFAGLDFIPDADAIPAQTYWRTSLDLNWTLNPTKILGAVGAAGLGIRRQELIVQSKEYETAESVITAYHGVILAAEQVAASAAELANQAEFLSIMRMRHGLGLATELDTLQAAVTVANLEPRVRLARQGLRTAGARLNAVMGLPPEQPVAVRNEQRIERAVLARDAVLALALQRPDLQQMDVMTRLLQQNRRAQKADLLPYLSLFGSYGYVGRRFQDLDDKGHDFWTASVSLNVPLFDGMLTRGLVQESAAAIRRNEIETMGLERQVRVEVVDLLDNLEAARANLGAAELNMDRADELLATSKLRLREGLADYLTVLESEASRAQALQNLIQARYDVLTLSASLKRAMGVSPLLPFTAVTGS